MHLDVHEWFVLLIDADPFYVRDDLHATGHSPEHRVLPVEPSARNSGDVELRGVRVFAAVGHS